MGFWSCWVSSLAFHLSPGAGLFSYGHRRPSGVSRAGPLWTATEFSTSVLPRSYTSHFSVHRPTRVTHSLTHSLTHLLTTHPPFAGSATFRRISRCIRGQRARQMLPAGVVRSLDWLLVNSRAATAMGGAVCLLAAARANPNPMASLPQKTVPHPMYHHTALI